MAAPLPVEINPALENTLNRANRIYQNYVWVARFIDEIVNDTDLDLKKIGQLVLVNGPILLSLTSGATASLRTAFMRRIEQEGLSWPNINTEFPALLTELQSFIDWVGANVPEVGQNLPMSQVIVNADGRLTDQPITITKPVGFQAEAQALRNQFG